MGNDVRYREAVKREVERRGRKCECCGEPASHMHHSERIEAVE